MWSHALTYFRPYTAEPPAFYGTKHLHLQSYMHDMPTGTILKVLQ